MLGARLGSIVALDANGHELKTLTTSPAGRRVTGIQLMPDHETLWYVTTGDPAKPNRGCPDVLTLNLRSNTTSVIGHTLGVAVTADGRRYVLGPGVNSDASVRQGCQGADFEDEFAVHDLGTAAVSHAPQSGAPIASSGPLGVAISPAGDRLITSQCSLDGCGVMTLSVPESLGAPLVWNTSSPVSCSCRNFVTADDALYAVVDTPMAPKAEVRRFAWGALSGAGTTLFSSSSPRGFDSPVPTIAAPVRIRRRRVLGEHFAPLPAVGEHRDRDRGDRLRGRRRRAAIRCRRALSADAGDQGGPTPCGVSLLA